MYENNNNEWLIYNNCFSDLDKSIHCELKIKLNHVQKVIKLIITTVFMTFSHGPSTFSNGPWS